jgi:Family of unknown function (DUF6062)
MRLALTANAPGSLMASTPLSSLRSEGAVVTDRVLTRWLRQGVGYGVCPLCRASHKLDREYIWDFFDKRSMQDSAVEEFARAGGFCAEHAEQYRRIEVDTMQSTMGIADVYVPTLERLCGALAALGDAGRLTCERCPACVYRDAGLANNAHYLLIELVEDSEFRDQLAASAGLCLPHFQLAWGISQATEQREQLLAVQLAVTRRLTDELRAHGRKQRWEARDEPLGTEVDSWRRAICLTVGWPAPTRSASLPEGENPYAHTITDASPGPAPAGEPSSGQKG